LHSRKYFYHLKNQAQKKPDPGGAGINQEPLTIKPYPMKNQLYSR